MSPRFLLRLANLQKKQNINVFFLSLIIIEFIAFFHVITKRFYLYRNVFPYTCLTSNLVRSSVHSKTVYLPRPISATPTFSLSFSTVHPSPRSAWIETLGNIFGPRTIGLSPRTHALLQEFKSSRSQNCSYCKDIQVYNITA